jgi:hypothetical protein
MSTGHREIKLQILLTSVRDTNLFHTPAVFISEKETLVKIASEAEWSSSGRSGEEKDRNASQGNEIPVCCPSYLMASLPHTVIKKMFRKKGGKREGYLASEREIPTNPVPVKFCLPQTIILQTERLSNHVLRHEVGLRT